MNIIIKKLIQYLGYFFGGIIFTIVFDPKILQNLNFSHSILFLGLISLIVFLYSSFYFKGTESDVEIFKIHRVSGNLIGIFTFFLLGSKLVKNKSFLESSFYKDISSNLFLSYLIVIITIFFLLTLDFLSFNKQNKKNKSDLYESRRSLLKILHEYLQTIDRFSIIGDWGIGKTILIENFFYNSDYSKNYELIYIDSSIYSSNENIIIKLENEIDNILEKYQIVKNKNSFTGDLFLETNTFLKSLYKLIFPQKSSYEIKQSLEKKFTTIEENYKKKIVLCLDNLERNNNSFKIIKLFSILSEILPENIKIIYIYDEIEMKKIFKFYRGGFINYISKYTFNKIEVRDIEIEEILESHRGEISNILNKISKKI
ncbi:MAG: hypothetical protein MJH09_10280, partial [Cetobacterium sp.]|nr:hypothetical protein [Cetobacterium sp.]